MSKMFVCGDTHGLNDFKKLSILCKNKQLTYDDYIIIAGDAGIAWGNLTSKQILKYESLTTNILFVDGNHEDYNKLNDYPIETWNGGKIHKISEHIFHLLRGEIFNINDFTFLALGGAESHDKEYRTENETWWADESITDFDISNAKENLKKHNNKVDYIITHTPCLTFQNKLIEIFTQCGENVPDYILEKMNYNESGKKLEEIVKIADFSLWFCGHLHIDDSVGTYSVLYEQIYEIPNKTQISESRFKNKQDLYEWLEDLYKNSKDVMDYLATH